ncbi:MAG: class II aldolase/adducin family protein [Gemmatimonadetes bacterium]|nr:class II aldolase/adducin family protein [Gemmatimonadota bacterium]
MRRDVARQIAECCRRLADVGLIAGADGNVAVRVGPDRALVTPTGMLKADLGPDDIVEVDLAGKRVRGQHRPSSELDMHLRILRARDDVQAVVHAHPPVATGFGVAGEAFEACVLPELIFQVGWVPVVPYGTPGTPELGERVEPYIAGHDALILANHGAVTMGTSLVEAQIRMESLEHSAKIILTARLLGRVNPLAPDDVRRLEELRRDRDLPGAYPGCPRPDGTRES